MPVETGTVTRFTGKTRKADVRVEKTGQEFRGIAVPADVDADLGSTVKIDSKTGQIKGLVRRR